MPGIAPAEPDPSDPAYIPPTEALGQVLDDWHRAASEADMPEYMRLLASDAVFLGTDPDERWTRSEFQEYVRHYFVEQARGWTYLPSQRHIQSSADGRTAWFDERLENQGYGVLRGTGVAIWTAEGWRITQYSMTFAVPNRDAAAVVQLLREAAARAGDN
ncbi:MAG: nuclear transport factor 2 family protein [Planctomycetota bacterium]